MSTHRKAAAFGETPQAQSVRTLIRNLFEIARVAYDAAPRITLALFGIRVVQALLPVASAYIAKLIFDALGGVLQDAIEIHFCDQMLPLILLLGGTVVLGRGLNALSNFLRGEMDRRVSLHVNMVVYRHLLTLKGLSHFESPRFHDTLNEASQSMGDKPGRLVGLISNLFGSVITLVSFFGVVLVFSPTLALILLLAILPQLLIQLHFRQQRFDIGWKNSPLRRKTYYLGTILANPRYASEIRLFNLGQYVLGQFVATRQIVDAEERKLALRELLSYGGFALLGAGITMLTYVIVIGQAFALIITLGSVTLYIDAARNVEYQLRLLSFSIAELGERAMFFTHYQTLLAMKPALAQHEPREIAPLRNAIELRNVSFRYDAESPYVLKDVSLTIRKEQALALVGLNGAGKTTLIKLLARFYDPTEGQILWDGVDIRHYAPDHLRARLGAVLQDFTRYDLTARENIGLGDVAHVDDLRRIQAAADAMGVHDFISDLPQGYDTVLSKWLVADDNKDADLSGGQWQKIAIARAYMRDADLLMLDEPTAALDAEAEHEIYERFAELTRNRACLLISHRFSTVRMADQIAVLSEGRIVERGTHAELMAAGGRYAELYTLQADQYA